MAGEEGVQLLLVRANQQEAQQMEEEARQARLAAIRDSAGMPLLQYSLPVVALMSLTACSTLLHLQHLQRPAGSLILALLSVLVRPHSASVINGKHNIVAAYICNSLPLVLPSVYLHSRSCRLVL